MTIYLGNCLDILPTLDAESVQTCVTSPPYYGLRDYGVDGQIGLEETPEQYVAKLVAVFREVWRVLRDDGTLWLNLGDSYAGSGKGPEGNLSVGATYRSATSKPYTSNTIKPKDLIGIPWMVAFALRADGWYLRQDIIWHKPNPIPESVRDRCTKAHEYIFLLSKSMRYYYDSEAMQEPATSSASGKAASFKRSNSKRSKAIPGQRYGTHRPERDDVAYNVIRNRRSVWTIATKPYPEAHFATFPPELIEPCILAGSKPGGVVLDPFSGSGTTGAVALKHQRRYIGIELNPDYIELADKRIDRTQPYLFV